MRRACPSLVLRFQSRAPETKRPFTQLRVADVAQEPMDTLHPVDRNGPADLVDTAELQDPWEDVVRARAHLERIGVDIPEDPVEALWHLRHECNVERFAHEVRPLVGGRIVRAAK